MSHLLPDQIRVLRRALLAKGAEWNARLTQLMDGRVVQLEEILQPRPGETPVERTRRALELIDSRLKGLEAGTYGRCQRCGNEIAFVELEQVPWADAHQTCPAPP